MSKAIFVSLLAKRGCRLLQNNSPLKYQFEGAPLDTFAALGALGQNVIVVPSQRLVLVRQGGQGRGPALTAPMTAAVIAALDNPPTALAHN